jgi:hypothetical protein
MQTRNLVVGLVSGLFLSGIVGTTGCKRLSGSFPETACKGAAFSLSEAVVPKLDYAELRDTSSFAAGEEVDGYHVLQRAGEPCKTARDKAACKEHVRSARATRGFSNDSNGRLRGFRYLVVTRGDDVTIVSGDRELAAALGTVEDRYEAAAIASIGSGLVPACEHSVRAEGSAFVVHLATDSCFGPEDLVVRVERDGRVTVVSRETKPGTCVGHVSPAVHEASISM